ncbi:MAG: hypothetical protein JJ850_08830 [Kordiimonadaceae bacterium]|nr:hypothetical protein [Kordiimonadaceae bacterium]MBO6569232.1 hypothetical protein [Kordiimonadaceae bacterium]MBO6964708.1 hypothetical protein [Kordiimonadaceae bacterium]
MRCKQLKFLPGSKETLTGNVPTLSIADGLDKLPNPKDRFGFERWKVETQDEEAAVIHLARRQYYAVVPGFLVKHDEHDAVSGRMAGIRRHYILPRLLVKQDESSAISVTMAFHTLTRRILCIWLLLALIVCVGFSVTFYADIVFGDGLINLTVNGEASQVPILPWGPVFVLGWLLIWLGYPAVMISNGWRKSRQFAQELLRLMGAGGR